MGQNLILNMSVKNYKFWNDDYWRRDFSRADKGFTVAAYNRTVSKVDAFLANEAKG